MFSRKYPTRMKYHKNMNNWRKIVIIIPRCVSGIPRDRWSLIYLALVLCGVGFLLPYNSFITAVDFYQVHFGFVKAHLRTRIEMDNSTTENLSSEQHMYNKISWSTLVDFVFFPVWVTLYLFCCCNTVLCQVRQFWSIQKNRKRPFRKM